MRADAHEPLKLLAMDDEDLTVISVHLQDAVLRLSDVAYQPSENRFVAIMNRFDWVAAESLNGKRQHRRCQCALRFDRVKRAQHSRITPGKPDAVELLAVTFEPAEAPGGFVVLHFAGGGGIRLEVECIEGELRDLGAVWETPVKPKHPEIDSTAA
jgi:hypothetical protein